MGWDVVVLNGGSSSGKTSLARALQELLPQVWLRWSVDDFVDALPPGGHDTIDFASDGTVTIGPGFRRAERAWWAGLAAMARAGTGLIVDDVFLDGAESQLRLRDGLSGLRVLWVGVHCDSGVATARETARPDRAAGMAGAQAFVVHVGVDYDLEVDTTVASPVDAALEILAALRAG